MRLIDGDALKESLQRSYSKLKEIYSRDMNGETKAQLITFSEAILRINEAPIVDAVPVVRCKDCLYRGHSDLCHMKHLVYDVANHSYYYADFTMDDYYCSFGERKDNHETD